MSLFPLGFFGGGSGFGLGLANHPVRFKAEVGGSGQLLALTKFWQINYEEITLRRIVYENYGEVTCPS